MQATFIKQFLRLRKSSSFNPVHIPDLIQIKSSSKINTDKLWITIKKRFVL